MLQVENRTPFATALMPLPDREGIETLFAVVKGTFTLAPRPAVAEAQVPVTPVDRHHGEPASSSIRVPSDFCLGKPGTDVLLHGSAWGPGGRMATQVDVSLRVGPLQRWVRVFGDRHWDTGVAGYVMSPPAPFARMPLVWERAFGGSDETPAGPRYDYRNPVGTGFHVLAGHKSVIGMPVPNLEDPASLISSTSDSPPPAGFAAVAAHWEPRRSFGGTYDAAWEQRRAPYLPDDFDPRFFHLAPPGLSTIGYLRGGEPVELLGATADGVLRFELPAVVVGVTYLLGASPQTKPAVLDTVIIEPDESRLVMVWRAALRTDKQTLKVRAVRVEAGGIA
jgi:hypothetical protein